MSLKYFKRLSSRGDTIVEVMIVLAILGLAISISYATANRSLLDTRQAQESSQASELVASQVETLRTQATPGSPQNIFQAGPYCFVGSTLDTGASCGGLGQGSLYQIAITGVAVPGGTFKVVASWADVEGQGNDHVTLFYNLYQSP